MLPSAGVKQDKNRNRRDIAHCAQHSGQLCAVHFAECAAHEASFLGGNEDLPALQQAFANDQAIVKLFREIEDVQVGTDLPLPRTEEFLEAKNIQEQSDTFSC